MLLLKRISADSVEKKFLFFNKAHKPRKYCTEHHKKGTPGRRFKKGQIPWNKKHLQNCLCENCSERRFNNCSKCQDKNWLIEWQCGKCKSQRPRRTKHGDIRKYIVGHEPKRPKGVFPEWLRPLKGMNHYAYKGGRNLTNPNRYSEVIRPFHPYAYSGYIKLHRIVMENYLTLKYDFSNLAKCGLKNLHVLL